MLRVVPAKLDIYDNLNGSLTLAWPEIVTPGADSYNVYVNGVLNENASDSAAPIAYGLNGQTGVLLLDGLPGFTAYEIEGNHDLFTPPLGWIATVSGLQIASYNPATQVATPSGTYDIKVVAVVGGVEVAATQDVTVSPGPTSVAFVTPMRRLFPFPNTGLD